MIYHHNRHLHQQHALLAYSACMAVPQIQIIICTLFVITTTNILVVTMNTVITAGIMIFFQLKLLQMMEENSTGIVIDLYQVRLIS